MAIRPQNSDVFIREVNEELRRDQLTGFWERWGKLAIGGILLLLLLVAGFLFWQQRQRQAAGATGETFTAILDDLSEGKRKGVEPRLQAVATSSVAGYRAAAQMTQADLLLEQEKLPEAARVFAAIAGDAALPQPYRDLALVRQTSAEFDRLQPRAVIARLQPLAQPGNPWFGSAGEMVAAAHLRANDPAAAGRLFGQIAQDEGVPPSIRQRAVQMAGVLGVDAINQTEQPAQ